MVAGADTSAGPGAQAGAGISRKGTIRKGGVPY
jgi:hypothetical protein